MPDPMHSKAFPLGVNFTNPKHNPEDSDSLTGNYDTAGDLIIQGMAVVPNKDDSHLTMNDWVYATRLAEGDI